MLNGPLPPMELPPLHLVATARRNGRRGASRMLGKKRLVNFRMHASVAEALQREATKLGRSMTETLDIILCAYFHDEQAQRRLRNFLRHNA